MFDACVSAEFAFTTDSQKVDFSEEGGIGVFCVIIRDIPSPATTVGDITSGTDLTLTFQTGTVGGTMPASRFCFFQKCHAKKVSNRVLFQNLPTALVADLTVDASVTFLSTAVENDMQCATATGVPDTMPEGTEVLGVSIIADSAIPLEYVVNGDGTVFTEFVDLNVLDDDGKSICTMLH